MLREAGAKRAAAQLQCTRRSVDNVLCACFLCLSCAGGFVLDHHPSSTGEDDDDDEGDDDDDDDLETCSRRLIKDAILCMPSRVVGRPMMPPEALSKSTGLRSLAFNPQDRVASTSQMLNRPDTSSSPLVTQPMKAQQVQHESLPTASLSRFTDRLMHRWPLDRDSGCHHKWTASTGSTKTGRILTEGYTVRAFHSHWTSPGSW
jgi:hypothetical protein